MTSPRRGSRRGLNTQKEKVRARWREKHPASPPQWPEDTGSQTHVSRVWKGETETLQEPLPVQRKTVSTPRSGREGSPRKPESQPGHSAWSSSPVARPKRPSALRARNCGKMDAGDDNDSRSGDERDRWKEGLTPLVRPTSWQEGDHGGMERPRREREPSADLALAILNGLDISSLPHSEICQLG